MKDGKKRERDQELSVEEKRAREAVTRKVPVQPFDQKPKVSFILENAAIKKAFIKKRWIVANCYDDEAALIRQKQNPQQYRSEIVHETLKEILDSRINGYGLIGAIYVKVANGVLFEVKPHVRIPRTLARFSGLMLELLEKSRILASDTNEILMGVVEEPVTRHLPANSRIIGISKSCGKLVDVNRYVSAVNDDTHLVFMVGASGNEEINDQYTNDIISVTEYPLEPQACTDLICRALERKWNLF